MPEYRELAPPPHLAAAVKCIWTMRQAGGGAWHRVTPDGCADILFAGGRLQVVGPMTEWRDYSISAGEQILGIRFRPGRWSALIGASARELTDRLVPLDCLWGARAATLGERLTEAPSIVDAARAAAASLAAPEPPDCVDCAFAWMERRHGVVSMDELADRAAISPRQLRRLSLERTGLTPKFLARVLRFRHAQERLTAALRPSRDLAGLALDCGYYDQAHFIHEFRAFSGRTPADGRFFQAPERAAAVSSGT